MHSLSESSWQLRQNRHENILLLKFLFLNFLFLKLLFLKFDWLIECAALVLVFILFSWFIFSAISVVSSRFVFSAINVSILHSHVSPGSTIPFPQVGVYVVNAGQSARDESVLQISVFRYFALNWWPPVNWTLP